MSSATIRRHWSGPTVADASTFADALALLDAFRRRRRAFLPAVSNRLEAGVRGDAPRDTEAGRSAPRADRRTLIGGRADAMMRRRREARRAAATDVVQIGRARGRRGARRRGASVCAWLLESSRGSAAAACVVISSGETTVTVTGTRAGRTQSGVRAGAASRWRKLGRAVALASVGTDGVDGPTDAAGAIVDFRRRWRGRAARTRRT